MKMNEADNCRSRSLSRNAGACVPGDKNLVGVPDWENFAIFSLPLIDFCLAFPAQSQIRADEKANHERNVV